MDAEFDKRRKEGAAPFDDAGVTLRLNRYTSLPELRRIVSVVVEILYASYRRKELLTLEDWHEHDGHLTEAGASNWTILRLLLIADEALKLSMQGDTYVRTDFFPTSREFLLRLYVPRPFDNPNFDFESNDFVDSGVFDLTCGADVAARVTEALRDIGAEVAIAPVKIFFDTSAAL